MRSRLPFRSSIPRRGVRCAVFLSAAKLFSAATLGCGAEFDPPSELDSLRVIAVHKSLPYARPGEQVDLAMLYHDGSEAAPRDVTIAWYYFCASPPLGDAYHECLRPLGLVPEAELRGFFEHPEVPLPAAATELGLARGVGDRFSFQLVQPQLSGDSAGASLLKPSRTPEQPPYGVAFVFFAACAGELRFDGSVLSQEIRLDMPGRVPLACFDSEGGRLGPEDFVVGYSTVYAYEELRNTNPLVEGIEFDGVRYEPSAGATTCVDLACIDRRTCHEETGASCAEDAECCSGTCRREAGAELGTCAEPGCDLMPCVDACRGENCPSYDVKPLVPEDVAEIDTIASIGGETFQEQMWVTYGVSAGSVANQVRLVNDATKGFNADLGTEYEPPAEPGYAALFAAVRDNRGGVGWVRQRIHVR